jgi:hypothetical protein
MEETNDVRISSAPTQRKAADTTHPWKSTLGSKSASVLVFLIPSLQFIHIKFTGVLSGSDLLLLVAFIVLALSGRIRIRAPIGRRFLLLCTLWLLSQIVTDIVRHSSFADYARGWSNIGMTLMGFSVMFTLLYGYPRRIALYAWGMVLGSAMAYLINPSELVLIDPWKFGLSYPITLACLLIASRNDLPGYWPIIPTAFAGILNLGFDFRNAGGICMAAALYVMVVRYSQKKGAGHPQLSSRRVAALALLLVGGLIGIYWGYQYAVSAGLMGEEAREKYEDQSSGKYGTLLGGRVEMLSSIPAIIDSPILGHGSWAKDPKYVIIEQQALAMLGYTGAGKMDPEELREGVIPSHSHILGAWVDAGVLGAIFWGWVCIQVCKMLLRTYPRGMKLLPLAAYAAFELLWDIPFSPYGAQMRIITPFYIMIVMNYLSVSLANTTKVAIHSTPIKLRTA